MPKTPTPDALRETWMAFFEARGHTRWPSDSLVPAHDPTLLFTGAGMNQFKDMFLGKGNLPFRRAATIQKCFRQGDLDNVGRTPRHLTFFEMLGHFSFGDYFKDRAIPWAFEFLTKTLDVPMDRLRVSVYEQDDEAFDLWRSLGFPRDRIGRFDARENFWPANAPEVGPNGPCGPCSEIFFDYGEARAKGDGGPDAFDSGRFVEIWNSVFTQFDRRGPNDLAPLPQKNIDCGVGFERVLAVLEGQYSPFGTTLFRPVLERIAGLSDRPYAFSAHGDLPPGEDARRMRRISDHARGACLLVTDGVKPSNEGRGYVLRRILRLAIRDGIQLGLEEPFLKALVEPVVATMGRAYPGLVEGADVIRTVFDGEEVRFRQTYAQGLSYLEEELQRMGSAKTLPGAAAFRLHDTYGFPVDLAERIAEERGLAVDREGFEREMEAQRERARRGSKMVDDIFAGGPVTELKAQRVRPTKFLGYDDGSPDGRGVRAEVAVVGIVRGDALAASVEAGEPPLLVVLDQTPFYAESGGQVGDRGTLVDPEDPERATFVVEDTTSEDGYVLHRGRLVAGRLSVGDALHADVDEALRDATRRNHTATHLLHLALKQVLGGHVRQEGSLVAPDRLRFDFSHPRALTPEEVEQIEARVNEWILVNDAVVTEVMGLDAAKASGAVSLFGEKYASVVRVVGVDSGSRELCGGTHCRRTGDIGSFRITLETSIAAGVRRLEAVTGAGAVEAAARDRRLLRHVAGMLKTSAEDVAGRVEALQEELKTLRKAAEKARAEAGLSAAGRLLASAEAVEGLRVQAASVAGVDGKALKALWDRLAQDGLDVAFLVGEAGGKAPVLVALSAGARQRGLDARLLLGEAAEVLGGGGGGKPDLAQGQGQDRARIDEALGRVRAAVRAHLAGVP
jgi:alanyl-tRNA synthetase